MPNYTYLIVGGGMTADAAISGIREVDPTGSVGLIGAESQFPYDRPPLSKGLWKGKPLESIWRKTDRQGVKFHLGRTARALDARSKRVTDDQGMVYTFDKLLLATGGTPRRLPFGGDDIIYYRTLDDYERLQALTAQNQRFAVIGGGFIGSEVAAALTIHGKKVVMAFPDDGIGSRLFPADLSRFLNDFYRQKGVEVLVGERVTGLEKQQGRPVLKTRNKQTQGDREIVADAVVAGIGIEWNSPRPPDWRWTTAFAWIMAFARAILTSTRREMSPTSIIPPWISVSASSTRTTPTRWADWPDRQWLDERFPMTIFPLFTRTCSSWDSRRSALWIRGWKWYRTGKNRTARA
jgi:hypothetical protein